MIKRFFRARQRPRPDTWLLLRPDEARSWQWLHWHNGAVIEQADWPPPAGWQALRCALLIPADAVSYFEISAPPGIRPAEWPLLLEDRLLQAPEAVLIGCVGRRDTRLQLVALERARLARWQQQADTLGITLERYWSEFQLCPPQQPGQTLAWSVADYVCQVQADEQGAQHWLALPRVLAAGLAATGAAPRAVAPGPDGPLDKLPSLVPVTRPRRATGGHDWRTARRLAGTCLGLALLWAVLMAGTTWQQGSQARAALAQQFGASSTLQQAQSRLRRAQREEQHWQVRQQQVAAWSQTLNGWLSEHPDWALQALGFDGRHWYVTLSGHDDALADTARWQTLGREIGGSVTLTREGESLTVRVDLEGSEA
ncbi:general secretion pathway protein L [Pseudomonas cuatrocienegasensis]|uniref:General secretion pathway protein L n=1 Tax=Pseudomonas cuatrocienegasensis TaxID=543360 RepID=A0ABY1BDF7_9PSED|nr:MULTISPECIES: GspL/Epsl periplasmic domain-containing protein [Pseudomonas]OEC33826.1 hypothetical protein A7D25_17070 [Pseudomonas sp. 21C1]SEQ59585.1 general secretion pathway protein L [Pseudomonas cuatrocienegasensis]